MRVLYLAEILQDAFVNQVWARADDDTRILVRQGACKCLKKAGNKPNTGLPDGNAFYGIRFLPQFVV